MRNVWKGLIVGGLTGVGAGAILDLFDQGSRLAGVAGKRAARLAPRAAHRIKSAASVGATRVQDADLSDQMREQVKEIVHRLSDADTADHAREAIERVAKKGAEFAQTIMDAVPLGSGA